VNGVAQQRYAPRAPDAPHGAIDNIVSQDGVLFGCFDKGSERDPPVFYDLERLTPVTKAADSDDFGQSFRAEVGHLFRSISAGHSD